VVDVLGAARMIRVGTLMLWNMSSSTPGMVWPGLGTNAFSHRIIVRSNSSASRARIRSRFFGFGSIRACHSGRSAASRQREFAAVDPLLGELDREPATFRDVLAATLAS